MSEANADYDRRRRNSAQLIAAFVEKRSSRRTKGGKEVLEAAPAVTATSTKREARKTAKPPPIDTGGSIDPSGGKGQSPLKQRESRPTAASPTPGGAQSPKRDGRPTAKVAPSPAGGEVVGDDIQQSKRRNSALVIQQAFKRRAEQRSSQYKAPDDKSKDDARESRSPSNKRTQDEDNTFGAASVIKPRSFVVEEWKPAGKSARHKDGPTQIIKYVYVGNKEDAQNLTLLKKLNIKFIVNCTPNLPNYHEGQFAYYQIPVKDSEQSSLTPYFVPASTQILNYLQRKNAVLVHCIAGCSRSVTICAALLISPAAPFRLSLKYALQHIKALRPIAHPNASFMLQLCAHEADVCNGASSVLKARGGMYESYPVKRFVQDSRSEGRYEMETEDEKSSGCIVL